MMILFLLLLIPSPSVSVGSPLEKLADDVRIMQDTLASIQGSLMTSVRLIQDQVMEVGNRLDIQFNSKLVNLDKKLEVVSSNLNTVKDRAGQWESLAPHLQALSVRTTDIEQKLEHFTRTHSDQLSEHNRNGQFRLEGITRKMEEIGSQVQVLDNRMIGIQDKISILPAIENNMKNITTRALFRHRGSAAQCQDTKDMLAGVANKVNLLVDKFTVDSSATSNGPNFEFLRSDPPNSQDASSVVADHDELEIEDARLASLIRKIVLPYKRANKKLKDMESEQGKLETIMTRLEEKFTRHLEDINRKVGDFGITTTDASQEQTQIIEGYGKTLAAVLQCCKGHSVDYNRFMASASPVIDRLDAWMVSWRAEVSQSLDRIQQQDAYHAGRIQQQHKELEKLLLEGLDGQRSDLTVETGVDPPRELETTTKSTSTTEQIPTTTSISIERTENTDEEFLDCSDLKKAGFTESKVYRLGPEREYNMAGRDFYTRYCNMESGGGGWTVIQHRGDYGEPKQNFTTNWETYKHGFGDLQGEFWFGNDYISRLSGERGFNLRVELESWDGRKAYAEYTTFRLDGEDSDYKLWIGGYSGNASDSLSVHNGYKFSTIDRNNDEAPQCCPCAPAYGGGWWFYSCFESNLNGEYFTNPAENGYYRGIIWELWLGDYSLRKSTMMIRPRDFDAGTHQPVPPDP
ncbi:angiopoietin-2 isoform X2 [Eurytemora carolleeae]|uniref:angiopoietin-2 isoform X2 n=1 Tax=Eurytemora carolleeae TaxID=1294199 RepID=UPI000C7819B8|nr:angiopoietin-2 isoform X2 [Eurytemora carolleeae]|eukprot:XP_023349359.1 angiopoietin-2-like isoform X2 [Eurytemora affinis]